jgi:hypothetical protein
MVDPGAASKPPRWGSRIIVVLVAAVAIPLGVTLLYQYTPLGENRFWPGCTFHSLTGLHCPGCGATRCCHALVHGDIEQALAWNPLFVLLLPYLIFSALSVAYTMWTGKRLIQYRMPGWTVQAMLWTLVLYWIARNLPFEPFTLLAPHAI